MPPASRRHLLALATLLAVLWAAHTLYTAVQAARAIYLGPGLRSAPEHRPPAARPAAPAR